MCIGFIANEAFEPEADKPFDVDDYRPMAIALLDSQNIDFLVLFGEQRLNAANYLRDGAAQMDSNLRQPLNGLFALRALGLALAYFIAGTIGLELAMVGSLVTLVWMPTGIAVAALFRWGWRYWPGVWVGAFAVNMIVSGNPGVSFGISLGNTLAPLVAAAALKRWRFNPDIASARDVLVFVVVAALLSMTLSASGGALSLVAGSNIATEQAGHAWFTWWLGDAVGVILCGMALITYRHMEYRRLLGPEKRKALAASLFWLALIGLAWMVVPPNPVGQILSLTFPVGVLVWVAFRLGPSPAALAVLVLAIVGSWSLVHGNGPFADTTLYLAITKFWAYMNTIAIVSLLVSALNGERTKAHAELVRSEERFRSLNSLSSDWFWEQDADFRLVRVEGSAAQNVAAIHGEHMGKTRWDIEADNLTHDDWRQHQATLEAHLPFYEFEVQHRGPNGTVHWASISGTPIRDPQGKFTGYRGVGKDITARKQAEDAVKQLAHFDTLTGLPNRAMFMARLAQEMAYAQRKRLPLALMLLDLDHFKGINDTMGHDQGDHLLVQAGQRIKACLRQSDTVARLGGDEFIIILSDVGDGQPIERVAEKVLDALGVPFKLEAGTGFVSASLGIALYPRDAETFEGLLKAADQAMYSAKDAGRNRFSFYTQELQDRAQERLWMVREMHAALCDGHFWVAYQPIVHLATGRCTKAEALLRWQHPERGPISPGEFITVAESCGLIIPIGVWVFEQAALQVRTWRETQDPQFQVSVNKSPMQFNNPARTTAPWGLRLAAMGLEGNSVVAEITEGLLLDGNPLVTQTLKAMEDAGIQVALDDFGTGFSSLAYLQKHDIDYLKIDQAFVRNMAPGSKDLSLCEAIVVMAHKLGLQVIAEGVETAQQRDLLRAAGCDFAQGYFFSRPVTAETMEKFLHAASTSEITVK